MYWSERLVGDSAASPNISAPVELFTAGALP